MCNPDSERLCSAGLARVTADLIASAPGYLAEARDPVGTRSEDSLAAATERAKWLDRFAQPQSASLLVPAGDPSQITFMAPLWMDRNAASLFCCAPCAKLWQVRLHSGQIMMLCVPLVAGTGARNAAAGQQQRPEASIPKSSAQRQQLSINELQRTLAQPPPISYRPAAPAATFQVRASELQKSPI